MSGVSTNTKTVRMALTEIEKQHLGKVLGYDTSECRSRTRSGVVKWILETYSDVQKVDVDSAIVYTDGSTIQGDYVICTASIGVI